MLIALTTGLRFRFAILLAAFASLCFVAPPAALAFGHGAATADCMAHADMMDHGKVAAAPSMKHQGNHSAPTADHQPSCCGLFCMSALVSDDGVIAPVTAGCAPFPARDTSLPSRVLERLDRPPISLVIV